MYIQPFFHRKSVRLHRCTDCWRPQIVIWTRWCDLSLRFHLPFTVSWGRSNWPLHWGSFTKYTETQLDWIGLQVAVCTFAVYLKSTCAGYNGTAEELLAVITHLYVWTSQYSELNDQHLLWKSLFNRLFIDPVWLKASLLNGQIKMRCLDHHQVLYVRSLIIGNIPVRDSCFYLIWMFLSAGAIFQTNHMHLHSLGKSLSLSYVESF